MTLGKVISSINCFKTRKLYLVLFCLLPITARQPLLHDLKQQVFPSLSLPLHDGTVHHPWPTAGTQLCPGGGFSSGITGVMPVPIHSCCSLTLISINLTLYLSNTALGSASLRETLTKKSPVISTFLCGCRRAAFSGLLDLS